MSQHAPWVALGYIVFLIVLCLVTRKPRRPFISNAELNRERVTVDFRVGRDCK